MNEKNRLVLAVALTATIMLGFNYFYDTAKYKDIASTTHSTGQKPAEDVSVSTAAQKAENKVELPEPTKVLTREEALARGNRISFLTEKMKGTIDLNGCAVDDLELITYKEKPDPNSSDVVLFQPRYTEKAYYMTFGFQGEGIQKNIPWRSLLKTLTPTQPIELTYDNGSVRIKRTLKVDSDYLFTVEDEITNIGTQPVSLTPDASIKRETTPSVTESYVMFEGAMGIANGKLQEFTYSKLKDEKYIRKESQGGWLGFSDQYWLAAIMPTPSQENYLEFLFHHSDPLCDAYETRVMGNKPITLAPKASTTVKTYAFAGAKDLALLDKYEQELGIKKFDLAIDFGWLYFITKPFFYFLDFLHRFLGSFALAILVFTVLVKLAMFPVANKSFKAMARMKKLSPKIEGVRKKYANDPAKMNQELIKLYKDEKVNPVSGCLPMVIQIPIFFALYKSLYIATGMRHAPFLGWIQDLSAPDPTSLVNLFGLLPFTPPSFLMIGGLPIIMGVTMYLQQKMSPQQMSDPTQAKIMNFMPVMMTILMAQLPAGLLIYWTWNNILSIAQQWWVTRSENN